MSVILDAARVMYAAGLCVVPIRTDGSKRPAVKWEEYERQRPTPAEMAGWFEGDRYSGLGLICGEVSGQLEMLELEGRAMAAGYLGRLAGALDERGLSELWGRMMAGYLESTPSGGVHFLFRVTDGPALPSTKLAMRPSTPEELAAEQAKREARVAERRAEAAELEEPHRTEQLLTLDAVAARIPNLTVNDVRQVLIETRGEGGFVVVAPSSGATHATRKAWTLLSGGIETIPTLTVDERTALYDAARSLDAMPARTAPATTLGRVKAPAPVGEVSPGDDFNARADWEDEELLGGAGWEVVSRGSGIYREWVRPGKGPREGISATTGRNDADQLFVFSTSTEFEAQRSYTKLGAYAVLHHGGDHSKAASALRRAGWGSKRDRYDPAADPATLAEPAATATADPSTVDVPAVPSSPAALPAPAPRTLDEVHASFRRWLGEEYDLDSLDVVLACAAVERLDGDPLWLLVVSGSGNAKTETVGALIGAGAEVVSTISSVGALLSATAKKERTTDATGGLLRKIGDRGILVVKDVTSILSMGRDLRAEVLAALREVYDGKWVRSVGTDGGKSLEWTGRVSVVGAVTTAWDTHHAVIATMGDRFALVRVDSTKGRQAAGRRALANVGHEVEMRAELSEVVGGLLASIPEDTLGITLPDEVNEELLAAADLVTLARTAVERDNRGEVLDAHAPEAPTRFAKMLGQLVRGAVAIGVEPHHARVLARRVARDSLPPLRLALLVDVLEHPETTVGECQRRLQKPRTTVDRALQELHVLGLLELHDTPLGFGQPSPWRYSLSSLTDADTLRRLSPCCACARGEACTRCRPAA